MAVFKLNPMTSRLDMVNSGSGDGDVFGPASSTDNALARWDGTTGKLLKNSPWVLNDNGSFTLKNTGLEDILAMATDGQMTNYTSSAGTSTFRRERSTTNAAIGVLTLLAESSGTVTTGFGGRLVFANETATASTNNDSGYIQSTWTTATAGSATSRMAFFTNSGGTLGERFSLTGSGNTSAVNFTMSAGQIIARATSAGSPTVNNVQYLMGITDTSAPRTVTLPTGASVVTNQVFIIKDESGGANVNNITVTAGGAINIDGATTHVISTAYGYVKVYWNGSKYFKIGSA